jgi:hypothetical protein
MMDRSLARLACMGIIVVLAPAACDAPVGPEVEVAHAPAAHATFGHADGTVATPFRANLFTLLEGVVPDPACGDFPRLLNTQVGEGVSTRLGRFSIRITFCFDVTDLPDDGVLGPGESLPYDNGFGILTAANGDRLHMEVSGAVLPSSHPDYDFEFHDPFTFVGGTGRFTGATGQGVTASFVDRSADRTDHEWFGILVLPRGR